MANTKIDLTKNCEQTLKNLLDTGKIKKGAYYLVEFISIKKTLKEYKDSEVIKHTKMVVRFDIDYSNTKFFLEQNKELSSLPIGCNWLKGYEEFLLDSANGLKVRMYTTNNPNHVRESYYTLNGEKTTLEYLTDNKILGKQSSSGVCPCFYVFTKNMISITI